jgi:hypothetical protein
LVNDLGRDLDRDITILHTLGTSQALASADWPAFYNQAQAGWMAAFGESQPGRGSTFYFTLSAAEKMVALSADQSH